MQGNPENFKGSHPGQSTLWIKKMGGDPMHLTDDGGPPQQVGPVVEHKRTPKASQQQIRVPPIWGCYGVVSAPDGDLIYVSTSLVIV